MHAPDLRMLSMLQLEKVLLHQGIPKERVDKLNRWDRAVLIDEEKYTKEYLAGIRGEWTDRIKRVDEEMVILKDKRETMEEAVAGIDKLIAMVPPVRKKRRVPE